ncbi:hypothetical protein MBLNU459_g1100t1 [Dothideomycetes sp. NU459]
MAEVFSVVASGVGVAGVAAQFADGIRKLCQFCKDVRDAPEEVRYAINELGLLTNLLSAMEVELTSQRTRFSAHANYEAVLVFCQQGTEQTTTIMAELDAAISKRGKRGSLRAAWKKPELDRYLQKIERAKTSLMFAYQQYTKIEAEVAEWRDLYREAVHLGIDLHSPEDVRGRKSTLMLEFLSACIVWRADPYETVLTDFIGEIQSWGVDILEFGREEERVIRTLENKELIPRWYNEFETIVRMTGFSYGPRVEDWQIWLSNPLDEWAGEFWDMVEHPERRSLPGAWVDEDS